MWAAFILPFPACKELGWQTGRRELTTFPGRALSCKGMLVTTTNFDPGSGLVIARARGATWPLAPALAQAALEQAPAIIYVYDVQAEKSVFQNRPFGELLGYARDGGNDWQRYIHADYAASFPEHRRKLKSIKPGEV